MAKAKQSKNKYEDLDIIVGNGVKIADFPDGKEREIFAVPLKDFGEFMNNVGIISIETLWTNFLDEATESAVKRVLELSFRTTDIDEIMTVVNPSNYKQIMTQILKVNGIEIDKNATSESEEADKKKE